MSKYYKVEDVLAIFSEEERPLNWTDSESEIQAQNDFDFYKGMIESLPTIEVSEDCISREQVRAELDYISYAEKDPISIAKRIVDNAPSAVPSRAEGEWVVRANGNNECSICGREKQNGWINFCGFCGAKMKG